MDSEYANLMSELSGGPKKTGLVPQTTPVAAVPWARPDVAVYSTLAPQPGMEGMKRNLDTISDLGMYPPGFNPQKNSGMGMMQQQQQQLQQQGYPQQGQRQHYGNDMPPGTSVSNGMQGYQNYGGSYGVYQQDEKPPGT